MIVLAIIELVLLSAAVIGGCWLADERSYAIEAWSTALDDYNVEIEAHKDTLDELARVYDDLRYARRMTEIDREDMERICRKSLELADEYDRYKARHR
jgi:SMC interacting uncharacterized protein involved in chromosome segregation